MGPGRIAASAAIVSVAVMLGACVSQSSAPVSEVSPAIAVNGPQPPAGPQPTAANWQWSDAGPAVYLNAAEVTTSGNPTASLSLVCNNAVPSIMITWDASTASVMPSDLTYRFDRQAAQDVSASTAGPNVQIVSDPIAVSQFIDQAAHSRQLVVSAGATQATFSTTDDAGNLKRFRTACPDGTN